MALQLSFFTIDSPVLSQSCWCKTPAVLERMLFRFLATAKAMRMEEPRPDDVGEEGFPFISVSREK